MKKLHSGDRVRVVKNVVRMKPQDHKCFNKKASRFFYVPGNVYFLDWEECPICNAKWFPLMDVCDNKIFTIHHGEKKGNNDYGKFSLMDQNGKILDHLQDSGSLVFCEHWLKPISIVVNTNASRINYVMQTNEVRNGIG